jgi:hypothetical protein
MFSGGPLTRLCPRPITSNRTCPIGEGAYWTLTRRLSCAFGQSRSASGQPLKSGFELFFKLIHRQFFRLPLHRALLLHLNIASLPSSALNLPPPPRRLHSTTMCHSSACPHAAAHSSNPSAAPPSPPLNPVRRSSSTVNSHRPSPLRPPTEKARQPSCTLPLVLGREGPSAPPLT